MKNENKLKYLNNFFKGHFFKVSDYKFLNKLF